MSFFKCWR